MSDIKKVTYTIPIEDRVSDLENSESHTTMKKVYKDISEFEFQKVIKDLNHDWDLTITIKCAEPPEDTASDDDAQE